jgi:hypothetical protein
MKLTISIISFSVESNDLQLEIHDDASQLQHVHIDSSISIVSIDTTPKRIVLASKFH